MGPLPRVQLTPPDDPDTAVAPTLETSPGTTTTPIAEERTRIRSAEADAEGAPLVQRTKTTSSTEATSQPAISSARALVERVGNEAGEDSQLAQIRRIAALMAECEDLSTTDDIAEARRDFRQDRTLHGQIELKQVPDCVKGSPQHSWTRPPKI